MDDKYWYCLFSFLVHFKPSEPYLSQYLESKFDENTVNNDIYPYSTYFYLPALVILGILSEFTSYRVAIFIGMFGRVICRFLLLFGTSVLAMQWMQIAYSFGTASEIIFYAYIYFIYGTPEHSQPIIVSSSSPSEPSDGEGESHKKASMYQNVISLINATSLISFMMASILADVLMIAVQAHIVTLFIISTVAVICATMLSVFVIKAPKRINKEEEKEITNNVIHDDSTNHDKMTSTSNGVPLKTTRYSISHYWSLFYQNVLFVYKATCTERRTLHVLLLFYIFANASFTVLYSYEISIYEQLNMSGNSDWNGSILAIILFFGALAAFLPSWIGIASYDVSVLIPFLALISAISATLIVMSILIWNFVPTIILLAVYLCMWQFLNTVVLSQYASQIDKYTLKYKESDRCRGNSAIGRPLLSISLHFQEESHDVITSKNGGADNGANNDSSEIKAPAYALAVLLLQVPSVVLQVIFQYIVFSSLQSSLQFACLIIALLYAGSAALFVCGTFSFQLPCTQ